MSERRAISTTSRPLDERLSFILLSDFLRPPDSVLVAYEFAWDLSFMCEEPLVTLVHNSASAGITGVHAEAAGSSILSKAWVAA